MYQQRIRPKNLLGEVWLAEKLVQTRGKELRMGGARWSRVRHRGLPDSGSHRAAMAGEAGILLGDAGGEKREGLRLFDKLRKPCGEGLTLLLLGKQDNAGLGAHLSGAERKGVKQALGQSLGIAGQRAGENEDRVAAGHLGKAGDRMGAGGGPVPQRAAGFERAGESHGLDQRMTHQGCPSLDPGLIEKRE